MIQALTDPEEFVVEKVLNSLASLADLGLFPKMKLWEIVSIVWPLICHPNVWVRDGSIGFISSAIKHLPETDVWCIIYPLLRPFLRSDIADVNEEELLENIEAPVRKCFFYINMCLILIFRCHAKFMNRPLYGPVKLQKGPTSGKSRERHQNRTQ